VWRLPPASCVQHRWRGAARPRLPRSRLRCRQSQRVCAARQTGCGQSHGSQLSCRHRGGPGTGPTGWLQGDGQGEGRQHSHSRVSGSMSAGAVSVRSACDTQPFITVASSEANTGQSSSTDAVVILLPAAPLVEGAQQGECHACTAVTVCHAVTACHEVSPSSMSRTMTAWPDTARPTRQVRPTTAPLRLRRALMRCSVPGMPALLSLPNSPTVVAAASSSCRDTCVFAGRQAQQHTCKQPAHVQTLS
jgi:hypothetical protein